AELRADRHVEVRAAAADAEVAAVRHVGVRRARQAQLVASRVLAANAPGSLRGPGQAADRISGWSAAAPSGTPAAPARRPRAPRRGHAVRLRRPRPGRHTRAGP